MTYDVMKTINSGRQHHMRWLCENCEWKYISESLYNDTRFKLLASFEEDDFNAGQDSCTLSLSVISVIKQKTMTICTFVKHQQLSGARSS